MISRWTTGLLVALAMATVAVPASAQQETELAQLIAAYSRELARVESYLGWYDQLQRLEIAQGRGSTADADAKLRARAQEVYQRSFSAAELEQVITQHRQAAAAYFAQVEQAIAKIEPETRAKLLAGLKARRQQYETFVAERLDPLPTLRSIAGINAQAQGQRQMTAALDPFGGQRERVLAALPDPEVARLAQSSATVFTATPPVQPPPPPATNGSAKPPLAAGPTPPASSLLPAFTWLGVDADRVGSGRDVRPDGRRDGHFRLRLALPGIHEIRAIGVQPADAGSTPVPGPRWSTRDAESSVLGVFFKDRPLNDGHVSTMRRFRDHFELDLYASDAGWFRPGQYFVVAVELGDGSMHRRLAQVSAAADPADRPVPGEMGARPIPGEMGRSIRPVPGELRARPVPGEMGARPVPGEMGARPVPEETTAATQEPPLGLEVGIDRPGADFATIALPPESRPEACRKLCDEAPQCRAFTYVRPGVQGAQPMCWLKSAIPERIARDCCVSGTR